MHQFEMGSILGFKKPPILLMGSGISQRYSADAPCWEELLKRIGHRIGLSDTDLVPIKNDAERHCEDIGVMPRYATELQLELDSRLRSHTLKIEDILNKAEMIYYHQRKADAVKIIAASECSKLTIDVNSPLHEEIECLKKLPDVVPCVITTNYDTIIEKDLFDNRFKTYSRVSDYYLSGAQGIGEVYKIHGTCTDPSTIVLNYDDYKWFRDKAHIVSAKILSILCDYPMVIMGYSAEDRDMKEILNNLISSLDDNKLREVERNIVFVEYDPDESSIIQSTRIVEYQGHAMRFRSLKTNDFLSIYREVMSMEASISPETIRKVRQVVKKVQISESSTGSRYKAIGIDDITKEDAEKLVVVITDHENVKMLESTPLLTVDGMIKDILGLSSSSNNPDDVVKFFLSYGSQLYDDSEYVPIFHYMNRCKEIPDSPYLSKFITGKDEQFEKKISTVKLPKSYSELSPGCTKDTIIQLIDEASDYMKPLVAMFAYKDNLISEKDVIYCLRYVYENTILKKMTKVNMKCAVSYIGYKNYKCSRDL